jgi:hypothetical protein
MPEEPPIFSIVIDDSGDAWQRGQSGDWGCAMGGRFYQEWPWSKLQETFGPTTFLHNGQPENDEIEEAA